MTAALLFAAKAEARDVKIERSNAFLKFTYEWPREAAADRRLDAFLRTKAAAEWRERVAGEEDNRKEDEKQNFPFRQGYETFSWVLGGQTVRLISLQGTGEAMSSGMAHPGHWNEALLWDRRHQKPLKVEQLFSNGESLSAITRAHYCRALDAERYKRLVKFMGPEAAKGPFDACPEYSDLSIAPTDANKNGRFDGITLVAAQGSAGTNAEGEYDISVPVSARLVAALRPEYRSSFEVQRQ